MNHDGPKSNCRINERINSEEDADLYVDLPSLQGLHASTHDASWRKSSRASDRRKREGWLLSRLGMMVLESSKRFRSRQKLGQ